MITTSPISPSVGRVVLFHGNAEQMGNGAAVVPALVTRVWSDNCVNLMVMRDASTPLAVTSVPYAEPEEADDKATFTASFGWHWMPYQKAVAAERDAITGAPVAGS